jgi:transposase-like protein
VVNSRSGWCAPAGYRFLREVIAVAVRWYLRYGLSYRDVEELLAERGITVDHVTIYRWVQTFTSEFIAAARPSRHATGDRWFVDETYVKVAGRWTYLYRAVNQHGQVIDVLVSERRNACAARVFFARALTCGPSPVEVTTDRAPVYPRIIGELVPAARHVLAQYSNNSVEADHGRLKARLRPMRGLKTIRSLRAVAAGHAFVQNLRRGHYEITIDIPAVIGSGWRSPSSRYAYDHGQRRGWLQRPEPINATAISAPTRASRVVLADDDVLLREGLAGLLARSGFDAVGQAGNGIECMADRCLIRVFGPAQRPRRAVGSWARALIDQEAAEEQSRECWS